MRDICFMVCIVTALLALLLGLAMIWNLIGNGAFAYRTMMTLGLLFVVSSVILQVHKNYDRS